MNTLIRVYQYHTIFCIHIDYFQDNFSEDHLIAEQNKREFKYENVKTNPDRIFCIMVLLLSTCSASGKPTAPEAVSIAAKDIWDYHTWSEDLGRNMWSGGGWYIVEADKTKEFSITDGEEGKVPANLNVLMSMGMSNYPGKAWCLNFEPTLYFGYGTDSDEMLPTKNFLMCE